MITVKELAAILSEEFEDWGDIDPYLFDAIADDREEADDEDFGAMKKALNRIVNRLNDDGEGDAG